MAQATQISPSGRASIAFELEDFTHAGDRLEVSGRWFGVRGRRFVRPTMTLRGPAGEVRSLADLEHKPWAAEDGETWLAAFAYPAGAETADEFELSVAPDITLTLPPPDGDGKPRQTDAPPVRARIASDGRQPSVKEPYADERAALRRELDALRSTHADQRYRIARLENQLSEAREAGVETTAAIARRDAAVQKLDALLVEHEELLAARSELEAERDRLAAERDGLASERDRALEDRDTVAAERDALRRERDTVAAKRDALRNEISKTLKARDAAVDERDAAIADRDAAHREREGMRQDRDAELPIAEATRGELESTRRELGAARAAIEQAYRERDAAFAEASAARRERDDVLSSPANMPLPTPPVLVRSSFRRNRLRSGAAPAGDGVWLTRGIAIAVFVVVLLALLIVLRGF